MNKHRERSKYSIGERCLVWSKDYSELVKATVIEILPEGFWSIRLDSGEIVEREFSEIANIPTKPRQGVSASTYFKTVKAPVLTPFTLENLIYEIDSSETLGEHKAQLKLLIESVTNGVDVDVFSISGNTIKIQKNKDKLIRLEFFTSDNSINILKSDYAIYNPNSIEEGLLGCQFVGIKLSIDNKTCQELSNKLGLILYVRSVTEEF